MDNHRQANKKRNKSIYVMCVDVLSRCCYIIMCAMKFL